MTQNLHFATSNKGKIKEVQAILAFPLTIASLDITEIQSLDLEKVAYHKVKEAYKQLKKPVFAEDVGFFIEAWNGFPGPFAKHLHNAVGDEGIIQMMRGQKNRKIIARAVIGYHNGKIIKTFWGERIGTLPVKPKGKKGWGWDAIFIPEGSSRTFAQMGEEAKNKISHRALALAEFKNFLIHENGSHTTSL
jgi:XTP/dITP diphosphohydrolase